MGHPTNGFTGRADFLQLAKIFFKESIDGSHDWSLYECREKYKWRVRFFKVRGRIRNMIARNGVKIPTSRKNREKWGTPRETSIKLRSQNPHPLRKSAKEGGAPAVGMGGYGVGWRGSLVGWLGKSSSRFLVLSSQWLGMVALILLIWVGMYLRHLLFAGLYAGC